MGFDGVLIDIDNTLYDYETVHARALKAVEEMLARRFALAGETIREAFADARNAVHVELRETASSHNRLLYFQRLCEALGHNPMYHAMETYDLYWDTFLDNIELFDGVMDFLEKIRALKVCFVTDLTAHIQYRKIARLKLHEYAGYLVTSEEAGREKPHPYMFMLALKKLGLGPEQVCMVGDSFEKDVIGATRLGIRSFWLNRDGKKRDLGDLATEFATFRQLAGYFNG